MEENGHTRLDQLLDLLADEIAERLQKRSEASHEELEPKAKTDAGSPAFDTTQAAERKPSPLPEAEVITNAEPSQVSTETLNLSSGLSLVDSIPSPPHAASLMARLALGLLIIIVLINIPLNAQGTAIARSIPSSAALVIADGLVVKESNSPDVWVYREGSFHWITTLDAFEYFGYRWQDVHVVEPGFLAQFTQGKPIYVLLKCEGSPHIYQLDQGRKRWIVDIPTFEAQGFVWGDVKFVPCPELHGLPDGDSIPPGRGSPPPPLP